MLLSIGMIIKNEEKYLRKCLEGLCPILEQVHSELIINDTGSTDASVEIAREFTDRVYETEWQGDFARARNHTLEKARGKWYMFVDADEIFTDTSAIVDFFNNGTYKDYQCACFKLINIFHSGKKSDFLPRRLYKMYKGIRFSGKIHESVTPMAPYKSITLDSTADHFGYNFETPESKQEKHQRNIGPLLELYETEKNDLRHIHHIINEYTLVGNMEEAKKYIDRGMELIGTNTEKIYFHVINDALLSYHVHLKNHEETIVAAENYFSIVKVPGVNALNARAVQAAAYDALKKHADAADALIKALDLYDKHEEGLLDDRIMSIKAFVSPFRNRKMIVANIENCYIKAGNITAALAWNEKRGGKPDTVFHMFVLYLTREKRPQDLSKLYTHAAQQHEPDTPDYDNIINIIEGALTNENVKTTVADAIINDETVIDDYGRLMRLRCIQFEEDLQYFIQSDRPFPQYYGDVIISAMTQKKDFARFLEHLHIYDTNALLTNLIRTNDHMVDIFLDYAQHDIPDEPTLKYLRVISSLAVMIFTRMNAAAEPDENLDAVFEIAMRLRHGYLSRIYNGDVYNDIHAPSLAEQDGFIYFMGNAYECKDAADTLGFVRHMRAALRVNPGMINVLSRIGEELKEAPAVSPAEQLTEEMATLKSLIYTLIDAGDTEKAAAILDSYAQVNPLDPDIAVIRNVIEGGYN